MNKRDTAIVMDTAAFMAALAPAGLKLAAEAEVELEGMAERIIDRARQIEGIPGPIQDAMGVEKVPGYIDVGVLPDKGPALSSGGDDRPSRAATALEYGHKDGAGGKHIAPHPFLRPAIADEIQASGGAGKLPAWPLADASAI